MLLPLLFTDPSIPTLHFQSTTTFNFRCFLLWFSHFVRPVLSICPSDWPHRLTFSPCHSVRPPLAFSVSTFDHFYTMVGFVQSLCAHSVLKPHSFNDALMCASNLRTWVFRAYISFHHFVCLCCTICTMLCTILIMPSYTCAILLALFSCATFVYNIWGFLLVQIVSLAPV